MDKKKALKIFWNQKSKPRTPTESLTFNENNVWWCNMQGNEKVCFQLKQNDKPGVHKKWIQQKQNKETGDQSALAANQETIVWDFQ